jgi:hypothetical protein
MDLAGQILESEAVQQAALSNDLAVIKTAAEIQASVTPARTDRMHIAIIVALGTLVFQIIQFGWSTWLQVRSQEDAQWRAAVQTVSLEKGNKALYGALNVETFYQSSRYRPEALSLVASSLPFFTNSDAFDEVLLTLIGSLSADSEGLLYAINRNIGVSYGEDFQNLALTCPSFGRKIYGTDRQDQILVRFDAIFDERVESLRDDEVVTAIMPPSCAKGTGSLNQDIWLRTYEFDSMAGYIIEYWRDHGRDLRSTPLPQQSLPSHAVPGPGTGPDLSHTIFRLDKNAVLDMTYLDLSSFNFTGAYLGRADLSHSSLRNANLAQTDLSGALLTGTEMRGANIDQADMSKVVIDASDIHLWQGVCNAATAHFSDTSRSLLDAYHLLNNDSASSVHCPAPHSPLPNGPLPGG